MAEQIAAPCGVDGIVKALTTSRNMAARLSQEHAHIWSLYSVLVNEQNRGQD